MRTGLPMEALLEKRASGNPLDPPQGYNGASATDQARLRSAATYIINQTAANGAGFYAYRDGSWMFALAGYALTGGPDKSAGLGTTIDIKTAMDMLVDRTLANQERRRSMRPPSNRVTGATTIAVATIRPRRSSPRPASRRPGRFTSHPSAATSRISTQPKATLIAAALALTKHGLRD